MTKRKSKRFSAAKWVDSEVDDVMDSYGNTHAVAVEFVWDMLEEGQYSDELTDDHVAACLSHIRSHYERNGEAKS